MSKDTKHPIDFVLTWVDGADPEWKKEKALYSNMESSSVHTFDYQDWGLLRYWFRGIEKYAPWVNKIYFVTWGHIPEWLNVSHDKLVLVNHKDYIPKEYLPTFNSNVIELNFHRIKGLSEKFVYFNDDMYIVSPSKKEDFFKNGLPCDSAIINPIAPANNNCIAHTQLTNAAVINQHFKKHDVIKKNLLGWFNVKYGKLLPLNLIFIPWTRFPGLLERHLPASLLKSVYKSLWEEEYDLLNETSKHKFRNFKVDTNQWLLKEWQIASGQFTPRKINNGKLLPVKDLNSAKIAVKSITSGKYMMVCINDHVENKHDLDEIIRIIKLGFETILPEKSSFEVN